MPSSSHPTRSRSPDSHRHGSSSARHRSRSRSPRRERSSRDDRDSTRDRDRHHNPSRRDRQDRDKGKDKSDTDDEGAPPEGVKEVSQARAWEGVRGGWMRVGGWADGFEWLLVQIDESDFFLKSVELKVWLDEEKGKVSTT